MTDKLSILEQMRGDRTCSPVFEYKGKKLKWKLLNDFERMFARTAAQRATYRLMTEVFDKEDDDTIRDLFKFHNPSQDNWQDWDDCYIIAAALISESGNPLFPKAESDHVVAEEVARTFTTLERADLHSRYLEFHDEHDPIRYTDEELDAVIDDVKKNLADKDPDSLRSLGSGVLRRLLLSTAADLVESEIKIAELEAEIELLRDKSSPGTSQDSSPEAKEKN